MKKVLNKFNKPTKKILLFGVFFTFVSNISGGLFTLYLWRLEESFKIVITYSIISYFFVHLSYILASFIISRISTKLSLYLSFFTQITALASIIIFKEEILKLLYIQAILKGIASGLFWAPFNFLVLRKTKDNNRDLFYSLQASLNILLGLFLPLISGLVIGNAAIQGFSGYYKLYILSIIGNLLLVLYSMFLPELKKQPFTLKGLFKIITHKDWKILGGSKIMKSFFSVSRNYILKIFSLNTLTSELNLGIFDTVTNILNALYLFIIGKKMQAKKRISNVRISMILLLFADLIFITLLTPLALFIKELLYILASPFFSISSDNIYMKALEKEDNKNNNGLELLAAGEIYIFLGRILGLSVFLIFLQFGNQIYITRIFFAFVSLSRLLIYILTKKIDECDNQIKD